LVEVDEIFGGPRDTVSAAEDRRQPEVVGERGVGAGVPRDADDDLLQPRYLPGQGDVRAPHEPGRHRSLPANLVRRNTPCTSCASTSSSRAATRVSWTKDRIASSCSTRSRSTASVAPARRAPTYRVS